MVYPSNTGEGKTTINCQQIISGWRIMCFFYPRRSTYLCIRHRHTYFINVTINHQINRSFIKSFNPLFSIYHQMGVSCKAKAARSANRKWDACTMKKLHINDADVTKMSCFSSTSFWLYFYYFSCLWIEYYLMDDYM